MRYMPGGFYVIKFFSVELSRTNSCTNYQEAAMAKKKGKKKDKKDKKGKKNK